MPDTARHVRGYLRRSDAVAALLNELQRRDSLLQAVRSAIPEAIRPHCKQASLHDGLLVVSVDSPTWVSRLKFLVPQLVDHLQRLDVAVVECRARALPERALSLPTATTDAGTFSASAAAAHLAQAAKGITDADLQNSLRRLAESLAARASTD